MLPQVLNIEITSHGHVGMAHIWHLCHSMLLPWFEILPKNVWWPVPPLWWPPTNHKATLYVVFGAFLFVHLVVVHSNLHLVV